ncbi:MAG TPA: hypothetical protein VFA97_07600 [Gaiellaceae bacterium]|nr:hypothetical protein [Gaiellaceae bacterium]
MRNVNPFLRNLMILALIALAIVVLNQETALATAGTLVRFAFFIVLGVVAYSFWRDIARHEIQTWQSRPTRVLYAAVGLLVLDIGWYAVVGVTGQDLFVFFVVAGIAVYVGARTWLDQKRLY